MTIGIADEAPTAAVDRRELVFAFVAPLGVDRSLINEALRVALCTVDYSLIKIRVSETIEPFCEPPSAPAINRFLERKRRLMDGGDRMRREFSQRFDPNNERGDAVALACVTQIRRERVKTNALALAAPLVSGSGDDEDTLGSKPLQSIAFLIDSLKHPDEIKLLKRVYGPAFISVGVHVPPETRRKFLLAEANVTDDKAAEDLADKLLRRDETGEDEDGNRASLGQDVSDAFNTTDLILDASREKNEIVQQLTRLVELIFGDPFLTPSREELGMFLARAAQVRSGSPGRQVGAAILRSDGSVVSVATNEAPRPISGGQYWSSDDHKYRGRDSVYQTRDTSDQFREDMVQDVLARLDDAGALAKKYSVVDNNETDDAAKAKVRRDKRIDELYFSSNSALRKSLVRDNIDYIRAVHAESASLLDAARYGVDTKSASMFATTFPCHECARHIVAAGIREVIYLSPYPKSAVRRLFADSIEIDPKHPDAEKVQFKTFVGVAPARYLEFFTTQRDRKDKRGYKMAYNLRFDPPYLPYYTPSSKAASGVNEISELEPFLTFLETRPDQAKPTVDAALQQQQPVSGDE